MTSVTVIYILLAPEGFGLPPVLAYSIGFGITVFSLMLFYVKKRKTNFSNILEDS
jgi:hypothetical protein